MGNTLNLTDCFLQGLEAYCTKERLAQVTEKARLLLLDYLGCTMAGATLNRIQCLSYVELTGYGDIPVIGTDLKATVQTSALLNGINAHILELDDGHRKGALHIGATVFSALLAVAERENLRMEDIIRGAFVGYEATARLACTVQPGNKLRGFHATGTCGTVGAALGIGTAIGLSVYQMKTVLSAAVTSAAGVLEVQEDGSDLKPLNVGRAAMDAVAAAFIGKVGYKAPNDVIGGKRGFLNAMTDNPRIDFLTDFTNSTSCMEQVYLKTYASCRHTHPAIEAALSIHKEYNFDISDILRIKAEVYDLAIMGHDHTEIIGVGSAKMSIPFCIALAIERGHASFSDFTEKSVGDEEILSLARKVEIVANDELTALSSERRASILTVYMRDGNSYTSRVDYPKGEPENPLTREDLEGKFRDLASYAGLTAKECDKVIDEIWNNNSSLQNVFGIICK